MTMGMYTDLCVGDEGHDLSPPPLPTPFKG